MKKAELAFVPFPVTSHITPAIDLAKLLVRHHDRLSITIVLMNPPFASSKTRAHLESLASNSTIIDHRITLVLLPHDYTIPETSDAHIINSTFIQNQITHLKHFLTNHINQYSEPGHDSPQLAGLVLDMLCAPFMDVADELGLPAYMFFTTSAGYSSLMFHIQIDAKDDPNAELVLPTFANSIPSKVLPEFMLDKDVFSYYLNQFRRMKEKAKGFVINTFMELEPHAIGSLVGATFPTVYTVGPLLNLAVEQSDSNVGSKDTTDDCDVIKWLDDQPPSSVVFLCFGHLGRFSEDQAKEIANALENSGIRFVWSLRQSKSGGYTDSMEALIKGFLNRNAGMGKIVEWAPQVAILSHPAVRGFVSHCGWNSILESVWFGVPIAAWPLYAEQQINAFEIVRDLGLAEEIRLDFFMDFQSQDAQAVVSAPEIEAGIRRVMEHDSDIRKNVKEISEKSRKALMNGGSSYNSIGHLINDVFDNMA
ncbi:hypothetical protein FEM48_Zijuj04G0114800 [Ziziphus jujuba var. spinosa]|uniref:Glycosyltransferase n=1 Tax=Ziziphus jujuba var. spinosa TaxID=714518 RepID=A0A978VJL8_ZIZJJ|nr:hypothetical protein FEM48_Zijuj04G0114800 [Ziziphus jujuba var. spinosa]